jgi:hypothetical protein
MAGDTSTPVREPAVSATARRHHPAPTGDVDQVGAQWHVGQVDQAPGEVGVIRLAYPVIGGCRPIEDAGQPLLLLSHGRQATDGGERGRQGPFASELIRRRSA